MRSRLPAARASNGRERPPPPPARPRMNTDRAASGHYPHRRPSHHHLQTHISVIGARPVLVGNLPGARPDRPARAHAIKFQCGRAAPPPAGRRVNWRHVSDQGGSRERAPPLRRSAAAPQALPLVDGRRAERERDARRPPLSSDIAAGDTPRAAGLAEDGQGRERHGRMAGGKTPQ